MSHEGTVIIGAGIIGCATAYFLSESTRTKPGDIHLVEANPELFRCASGFAGGFVAKDWFAAPLAPLGALSFELHKTLAEKYDGRSRWGYSLSTGTSLVRPKTKGSGNGYDWLRAGSSRAEAAGFHEFKEGTGPAWLTKSDGDRLEVISEDDTVAQVDPLRLSKWLLNESLARGVQLVQPARPVGVVRNENGVLTGVKIEGAGRAEELRCSTVVITAGPWSSEVFSTLFPQSDLRLPVTSLAGHSLVVRSPRWSAEHEEAGCHAVFTTDVSGFSPEIFSRIGGEIYVAGLNSSTTPLPEVGADVPLERDSIQRLKEVAKRMLGFPKGQPDDLQVLREGLCFRPATRTGLPIVCRIPDEWLGDVRVQNAARAGVFVATGHGPWGISQSIGTGKVMSELIEGVKTSADVSGLAL